MFRAIFFLSLVWAITSCTDDSSEQHSDYADTAKLADSVKQAEMFNRVPRLKEYWQRVKASLAEEVSVLQLENLNDKASLAQQIALKSPQFTQFTKHPKTKQPLRNEIMTIRPVLPEDFTGEMGRCSETQCYRVEMYNYFYNNSTIAFVDINNKKVLGITRLSHAQPDLNKPLIDLAKQIANTAPEVQEALGTNRKLPDPVMAPIKTALKNSRCERSHHLCVAPTFLLDDKALWAIVDLTDGKLVGTRWTELGTSGPPIVVSERSIENEYVFYNYCEHEHNLVKGDWSMDYVITGSDGLQITKVKYKGRQVIRNAKLLDWHVSYSSREGFGYSDATGCPLFSSAVVIAYNAPQTEAIVENGKDIGFALIQDFRQPPWPTPCNYRYVQRYEFYNDGRFRVAAADYGRGCGTDGTYRPVIRIDVDAEGADQTETLAEWKSGGWQAWDKEGWRLQDNAEFTDAGYQYRLMGKNGKGFYIEPGRGQFGDGGRGDHAFTYATVYHKDKDEGEQGTVTIGSCCNADHRQGPEKFQEPAESLQDKNLVFWYVPQLKNNGDKGSEYCWADTQVENGLPKIKVWPCYAGPMFVPINGENNGN